MESCCKSLILGRLTKTSWRLCKVLRFSFKIEEALAASVEKQVPEHEQNYRHFEGKYEVQEYLASVIPGRREGTLNKQS